MKYYTWTSAQTAKFAIKQTPLTYTYKIIADYHFKPFSTTYSMQCV